MLKKIFSTGLLCAVFFGDNSLSLASDDAGGSNPTCTKFSQLADSQWFDTDHHILTGKHPETGDAIYEDVALSPDITMTKFAFHGFHNKDVFCTRKAMVNEIGALGRIKIDENDMLNTMCTLGGEMKLSEAEAVIPINARLYKPVAGEPKGIVYVVPSRLGHDIRTKDICERFARQGLAAVTYDYLNSCGLDLSKGMQNLNALMAQVALLQAHNAIREIYPDIPVAIHGTSLGSFMSLGALWKCNQDLFPNAGADFRERLVHVHYDSAVLLLLPKLEDGMFGIGPNFKGITIFQGENDSVFPPIQLEHFWNLITTAQPSLKNKISIQSFDGFAHDFRAPKSLYKGQDDVTEQMTVYGPVTAVLANNYRFEGLIPDLGPGSLLRLYSNEFAPYGAPQETSFTDLQAAFNVVEQNAALNIYHYTPGQDSKELCALEMKAFMTAMGLEFNPDLLN